LGDAIADISFKVPNQQIRLAVHRNDHLALLKCQFHQLVSVPKPSGAVRMQILLGSPVALQTAIPQA
jgi:hypothetical protein